MDLDSRPTKMWRPWESSSYSRHGWNHSALRLKRGSRRSGQPLAALSQPESDGRRRARILPRHLRRGAGADWIGSRTSQSHWGAYRLQRWTGAADCDRATHLDRDTPSARQFVESRSFVDAQHYGRIQRTFSSVDR